ncbi:hypothetical protein [Planomicrobium sp. CPCC 101110]|nr:hypothetical protein [Planomicrobium sp. CPCC 101110]
MTIAVQLSASLKTHAKPGIPNGDTLYGASSNQSPNNFAVRTRLSSL